MELYLQISPTLRCCTRPPSAATVNFKILQHLSQFKEIKQPLLGIKIPAVSQSPIFICHLNSLKTLQQTQMCYLVLLQQNSNRTQQPMGSSTSTSYGHDPTPYCKQIQSEPGFQLYQSVEGQEYEVYLIPTSSTHLDISYEFRINNKHSQLVDILFAGQKSNIINCTSPTLVRVVTERIPYRLVHLPPQNPENAFTLLHQSLLGFKDLFKVNGLMCVKDTMIGVSAKNTVKVWMNPNFAVNVPEPKPLPLKNLDPTCHQRQMIHNIFDLVNSKAENHPAWRELIRAHQRRPLDTFDQALLFLDEFAQNHKIPQHQQLKNPFNKSPFPFRDQNSQIDKLQDLKLNRLVEGKAEEKGEAERLTPAFQRTIMPVDQKKNNLAFADIKNKCMNTNANSNRPDVLVQTIAEGAIKKQPFLEIQKNMNLQPQESPHMTINQQHQHQVPNQHQHSLQSQPTIFHQSNSPPVRIPIQIINKTVTRPLPPSPEPRLVSSVPKRFQIKFHYAGQQSGPPHVSVQKLQLPIHRSNSEPKTIVKQHPHLVQSISINSPQQRANVNIPQQREEPKKIEVKAEQQKKKSIQSLEQHQRVQSSQPAARVKLQQAQPPIQETPISITQIQVSQTINMIRQPQQSHEPKTDDHAELITSLGHSPPIVQQELKKATPSIKQLEIQTEHHEGPSYQIRVHQHPDSPLRKQPQSQSHENIPEPSLTKKKSSLLEPPEPQPIPREKDIFKEIARLAQRPFDFGKKMENISNLSKRKEVKESGMCDSRQSSRKGPGSPRNQNSGMSSSIMSKNKLPKVSYKEMRKMLLETLQES